MADNELANSLKFLRGDESKLPADKSKGQVYFAYKNVGTAEKPSYTGAIYMDAPINGAQTRVKMTANADIADKAINDSNGKNILSTYLQSLSFTDDGKQVTLIKGNGNNQTKIALPIASATKAGIVTTEAQTFGGTKTFATINTTNLTVSGTSGFAYTGIETATGDSSRPIWFTHSSATGKPVINTNFTYNPATQTLTVANLAGTAADATNDGGGKAIRSYLNDISISGRTITVTRGNGNTITLTTQDTNTWRGIQDNLTSDSTTDSLSAKQGKYLKSLIDGKANSGHNHDDRYYTETEIDSKLKTYVPLAGGTMTGALNFQRTNTDRIQPNQQDIVINGISESTATGSAPGIGFHIGNKNWGSLKFLSDGSFRFYNASANGYMPVYASNFYGALKGNADTATNATSAGKASNDSSGNSIVGTYISSIEVDANNSHKYNLKSSSGLVRGTITIVNEFQRRSEINATVDWNTLLDTGTYKVQMSAWGDATKMHSPNSYNKDIYNYGILLVLGSTDADITGEKRVTQIYIPHNASIGISGSAYKRMHNGSDTTTGWQDWHPIARGLNWSELTGKPSTFPPSSHTHNYAGSSSAGGAATSANKLNTNAGSSTKPVYFSNGIPVQCSDTLSNNISGNANTATLLKPSYTASTLTTGTSTWRNGVTEGKVVWGQRWKDTSLSGDTGDITLWIKQSGSATTLNMTLDGSVTAVGGFIGNASSATALTSSAGSATQPIYFKDGKPTATSYSLNATVNGAGTGCASRLAYYSGDNTISSIPNFIYKDNKIYFGTNNTAGGYLNGNATNGGCNSILIGDNVWLGDVNVGGMLGLKSNSGNSNGFVFFNSSGTEIGRFYAQYIDANNINLFINKSLYPTEADKYSLGNNNNYFSSITSKWLYANVKQSGTEGGVSLFGCNEDYSICFRQTSNLGTHGFVSGDWATYFIMSNTSRRGWIFRSSKNKNVVSIDTDGNTKIDGLLVNSLGFACNGNGKYSYYKIMTINITGSYINRPISFEVSGRGKYNSKITILFSNTDSKDPSLYNFITDLDNAFFIKKTATSTWEVYGQYSEPWGTALIHRVTGEGYGYGGINITWNMTNIDSLPDGTTKANYAYNANYANSAAKLTTARTINGTSFDGSANITTANWGTARTITIGNTGKSVNGSGNISWSLNEIGAAAAGHTHNYAGSSSAGGSANSAVKLDTTTAGSSTQPVYFTGGKPVACTYTLAKSVPSDAKFTDTNTWRGIQNNVTSDSTTDSLSAAQGKYLKGLIDGKAASNHGHNAIGLPRITKNANEAAQKNTFKVEEFSSGTNYNLPSNAWYHIYTGQGDDVNYATQLALGMTTTNIAYRIRNGSSTTWNEWNTILHSSNYTSYTVTKTGSGASGTWGISVSGSSASCTGNAATATKLATTRSINGTNFDGSANITTANWGTARNIAIRDCKSANTGTAVSVNGSQANYYLLMPSSARFTGTLGVGNDSGATLNFYTATDTIGAKIVAYSDRIEFVFA